MSTRLSKDEQICFVAALSGPAAWAATRISDEADRLEDFGVFAKTVPLEPGFGELTPVFSAGAVVEHPAPAGVFP